MLMNIVACLFAVLGTESRISHILGKHFNTELRSGPMMDIVIYSFASFFFFITLNVSIDIVRLAKHTITNTTAHQSTGNRYVHLR
jgi:hypothetical protein